MDAWGSLFLNALSWWEWLILAAVPPLIVLLYFLKLRRAPLEVPSTLLWRRTLEDLRVNTIWQRLRQNLLLFLQLLLVALLMLAALRPGWRGQRLLGKRHVFLVDVSASMSATDAQPTRLDAAKQRVAALIDQMGSGDVAMLLSFADRARVEQQFTDDRALLRRKLARVRATERPSDLGEALRAAAGLANPGRVSEEGAKDVPVADPLPATLYIFSDGGFANVPDFALGNLEPRYFKIGSDAPRNVGVTAFSVERNFEKPTQLQAFAQVENHGPQPVSFEADLYLNDQLRDARQVAVAPGGTSGLEFELSGAGLASDQLGALRVVLRHEDDLPLDNAAHAVVNPPRRARVLLVTPKNEALRLALGTDEVAKLADVALADPAALATEAHQREAAAGLYDLVIYDQCAPAKEMPRANTLFFGRTPPTPVWKAGPRQGPPIIIDLNRAHPIMQLLDLGDVRIAEGFAVRGPPGGGVLIDADIGPLAVIGPRDGFEDLALGFELLSAGQGGAVAVNTDWPIRRSFPMFVMNALKYLGGGRLAANTPSVKPGQPVTLRANLPVPRVEVRTPAGEAIGVAREGQNSYLFQQTEAQGVYAVREGNDAEVGQRFVVNLFDSRESDLRPRDFEIGFEKVTGSAAQTPTRREVWKWLLLAAVGVLAFEWYVYNRRVYL